MTTGSKTATNKPLKLSPGIELRCDSLRINFSYRGQRCRETLTGLAPTKANAKFAANKLATIKHEIATNTFDYAAHFPESKKALLFSGARASRKTVEEAVKEWLEIKKAKTMPSTYANYRSKALTHVVPKFGKLRLQEINLTMIEHWRARELGHLKNKTINEIMIVLRGVLKAAKADRIIEYNPSEDADNLKTVSVDPDPFTRAEIEKILKTPTHRQQEINMIEFNIWSGLRVSELIALAWEDIDLLKGIAKVQRANVKGKYKIPKTSGSVREVELLAPAIEALQRQKAITFMLKAKQVEIIQDDKKTTTKESLRFIFLNSNTGEPHANDNSVRDRFFSSHLKKAGVRYRGPNQARHTFASQMLTNLVPKEWIAKQMGHTSIRTLEKHYAKWIREDAPGMAQIVNQMLGFAEGKKAKNLGANLGQN